MRWWWTYAILWKTPGGLVFPLDTVTKKSNMITLWSVTIQGQKGRDLRAEGGWILVFACSAAMVSSSPKVLSPRWPWSLGNKAQHYLAMKGLHMIAAAVGVLWEGRQRGPSLCYSSWRVQSLRWGISGVTITKHRLTDAIEQSAATVSEREKAEQVVRHASRLTEKQCQNRL